MNEVTNNDLQCTVALAALHNIYDPEIGLNVVDLGLIYQLDFDEENKKVFCTMTLTTQYCPMGESITSGVQNMLEDTFPGFEVSINLIFDPPWNYQMISPEGKEFLNL